MKKVKIVLVGVGGYGNTNLNTLRGYADADSYEIVGVVDPMVTAAPCYPWLVAQGIALYQTLEDFYRCAQAELAIISTPIPLHLSQTICALDNGSNVLCEKPMVPRLQELTELQAAWRASGRLLGVGFQWSFCQPMLELKKDLLAGRLGRPLRMKVLVSWPRDDAYYSAWRGHIRNSNGDWVLDCIATNATAHYLHNLCFLMGSELATAQAPSSVNARAYRAKAIDTYDTCFIGGSFSNGCQFRYLVTHSDEQNHDPVFEYTFENATVRLEEVAGEREMVAYFSDGTVRKYGDPQSDASNAQKMIRMIEAVQCNDSAMVTCTPDTVLPHLQICNAIFDQTDIAEFPAALLYSRSEQPGSFVHGLYQDCKQCYDQFALPYELSLPWALPEQPLNLAEYHEFTGKRLRNPKQ